VRDVLKDGKHPSTTYCHCGAGFYNKNLEEILGRSVSVEMVQTVLSGDEVPSFVIRLPASVG
jgi:predicted hydrocarbon binding protein